MSNETNYSLTNQHPDEPISYIPPQNIEAEQAVLGSLLSNNELWYEINNSLSADDFYNIQHKLIFKAIVQLFNKDKNADIITLTEELEQNDTLDKVGNQSYLVEIMTNTPSASNIVHYAEIVRTKSVMRQLYEVGQNISKLAYNPEGKPAKDILDEAEQLVFNIAEQNQHGRVGFLNISNVLNSINEKLAALHKSPNNGITGVKTGFYDLDKKTAGLQAGDLIIIAGRPSMGKTAFAVNIAEYVAIESGTTVAIFSMEMPADQLATRMLGSLGEIDLHKIKTGQFADEDWDKFAEAYEKLNKAKLFIDETGGLTSLEIKARIRRLKRQNPDLSLVVIDYIQLMNGLVKSDNRNAELGEISRSIKALAKEINVPIIVLSQLSRNVESRNNKRPLMSDLRDSGAIEQDADLIIFMYRDSYYQINENSDSNIEMALDPSAEAIISKHRNGSLGIIPLYFKGKFAKFTNPSNINYNNMN